jgi:ubiquinone/menaquinone biosynthesis C-methylase UbiE
MLEAARGKLAEAGAPGIDLRQGEAGALPLEDGEVAAAFAHMVIHYLPSPAEAIREMARVVAPGGVVIVVDFVAHEHEWMRQELGVHWLGFATEEVEGWFREAGLHAIRLERFEAPPTGRDLPATFIASARRPR